jgi:hypothetical protein
MTYIDFKKRLLDLEMSLPQFCELIKISDKNLRSYKKKAEIPNALAALVTSLVELDRLGVDFRGLIEDLRLEKRTKKGGFTRR